MPDWTIPFPTPPTPLRRPCRRDEVQALMARLHRLRIEMADTELMLLGLITEMAERREEDPC